MLTVIFYSSCTSFTNPLLLPLRYAVIILPNLHSIPLTQVFSSPYIHHHVILSQQFEVVLVHHKQTSCYHGSPGGKDKGHDGADRVREKEIISKWQTNVNLLCYRLKLRGDVCVRECVRGVCLTLWGQWGCLVGLVSGLKSCSPI